jgi:hypothetical protein
MTVAAAADRTHTATSVVFQSASASEQRIFSRRATDRDRHLAEHSAEEHEDRDEEWRY